MPTQKPTLQLTRRATRRTLDSLDPTTTHPQPQCLLFTKLPLEIRNLIYSFTLTLQHNKNRPYDLSRGRFERRAGHMFNSTISLDLLLTCRRIYSEAHQIPLKSATLHFLHARDHSIYHMSSQQGKDIYHCHDIISRFNSKTFSRLFREHLHWKRVTWTLSMHLIQRPVFQREFPITRLAEYISNTTIPSSCHEVTLELDGKQDYMDYWSTMLNQAENCRLLEIKREDGVVLPFDAESSVEYVWDGWGRKIMHRAQFDVMEYRTVRLTWRTGVARRKYTSWDRLECLVLRDEVKSVKKWPG